VYVSVLNAYFYPNAPKLHIFVPIFPKNFPGVKPRTSKTGEGQAPCPDLFPSPPHFFRASAAAALKAKDLTLRTIVQG